LTLDKLESGGVSALSTLIDCEERGMMCMFVDDIIAGR